MKIRTVLIGIVALFGAAQIASVRAEGTTPAQIADAFHEALTFGNAASVGLLLAPDVTILEGDHAQKSRQAYMEGHMKSDMAFMPYMQRTVLDRQVSIDGDLAWVTTFSKLKGSYNDRAYDLASRELLVMRKTSDGWQITLVHWSEK